LPEACKQLNKEEAVHNNLQVLPNFFNAHFYEYFI
jgi:hypothetical protein